MTSEFDIKVVFFTTLRVTPSLPGKKIPSRLVWEVDHLELKLQTSQLIDNKKVLYSWLGSSYIRF